MYHLRIGILVLATCGSICLAQTVNYTYDEAGRLITADYGGGKAINYTYDNAGNLLRRETTSDAQFFSLSSASFDRSGILAPEAIATGFGPNLATGTASAPGGELPTELLGTSVDVTDSAGVTRRAQLISVTPTQISYIVPGGTALGAGSVTVNSGAGGVVAGVIQVANVAPGLYTANFQGTDVAAAFFLRVAADGTRTQDLIFDPATATSLPLDLGAAGDQLFVLLFGTGLRNGNQATATAGGESVPVLGGKPLAHSVFPGLDQANIGPMPLALAGRGEINVILTVDGQVANTVVVNIQ